MLRIPGGARNQNGFLVPGSAWNANWKRLSLVLCELQAKKRRREPPMLRIPGGARNQNDFSIFIFQFNFFNGFAASERYDLSENAHFPQASAFSDLQAPARPLLG